MPGTAPVPAGGHTNPCVLAPGSGAMLARHPESH